MRSNILTHRLKEQIEALKGGVTTAANHLGKSRNTIYNWIEKGNVPLNQLEKLSEIDVDIYYILTGISQLELSKMAGYTITGKVSESPKQYQGNETLAESPALNESARQSAEKATRLKNLDHQLGLIIDDYTRGDTLAMVTEKLEQMLVEEGLVLEDDEKTHLIEAAQKAYQQLMMNGHAEKFNALLKTLVDVTLTNK